MDDPLPDDAPFARRAARALAEIALVFPRWFYDRVYEPLSFRLRGDAREFTHSLGKFLSDIGWGVWESARGLRRFWEWERAPHLVFGAPAVIALLTFVMALWMGRPSAPGRSAAYQSAARAAMVEHDLDQAALLLRRQHEMQPSYRTAYELALVEDSRGNADAAVGLMRSVAPPGFVGYAPAHLWIARRLVQRHQAVSEMREAELHLQAVIEEGQGDDETDRLMGHINLALGQFDAAAGNLQKLLPTRPEWAVTLARLLAQGGDRVAAMHLGQWAAEGYLKRVAAHPDHDNSRLRAAEALLFLRRFDEALDVLGGAGDGASPTMRRAMAHVYATWASAASEEPSETVDARVALVAKALDLDPAEPGIQQHLMLYGSNKTTYARRVQALVCERLRNAAAPAGLFFVAGTNAWLQGDAASALQHLERALALAPDNPDVANHLAWVLAHQPEGDLPRARQLAAAAVAREPDRPEYRDTLTLIEQRQAAGSGSR